MIHHTLTCLLLSCASFGAFACGGGDKQSNVGQPAPVQCPPGQSFDGQKCLTPGALPSASAAPSSAPSATTSPAIVTSAPGSPAQPIDASAAGLVTVALAPLAKQFAPGAKAVGTPNAANFQQGQTLESQVQMNPGKCYTVVGAAVPTVQNLDIELVPLVPIPGFASPVVAADKTQSSTAVVAPAPNCFKWALLVSGSMKVVMRVSAGQGLAAMQVYEK